MVVKTEPFSIENLENEKNTALQNKDGYSSLLFSVLIYLSSLHSNTNSNKLDHKNLHWCLDFLIYFFNSGIDESFGDPQLDFAFKQTILQEKHEEINNVLLYRIMNFMLKEAPFNVSSINYKCLHIVCISFNVSFANVLEKVDGYEKIWNEITETKSLVSSKFKDGSFKIGPQIMAVKVLATVVQTQLPLPPKDPRKREKKVPGKHKYSDISMSMARSHPLINENLKAQALAYMDLLISAVTEKDELLPQVYSAIFFVLNTLVKKRPLVVANKIVSSLVYYDSAKKVTINYEDIKTDPNAKIIAKLSRRFSDRAFKILLDYLFKNKFIQTNGTSNAGDHMVQLSSQYINKINTIIQYQERQRKEKNLLNDLQDDIRHYDYLDRIEDENKIKEILSGNDELKRADVDQMMKDYPNITADDIMQRPGSNKTSYAKLFTLIDPDSQLGKFDTSALNTENLSKIVLLAIKKADSRKLTSALTIVAERYRNITNHYQGDASEDKEGSDRKRIKLEDGDTEMAEANSSLEYKLPIPPRMTFSQKKDHLSLIISNFLKLPNSKQMQTLIESQDNKQPSETSVEGDGVIKMSKVAISKWEKNSWAVILIRLATRGLYNGGWQKETTAEQQEELSDLVREALFNYFMENIQHRMDIVIDWLNEEWYSEYVKCESASLQVDDDKMLETHSVPSYFKWTFKILDSIIPFLEAKDRKVFIRLFSDLPYLNKEIIMKLRILCLDTFRFKLGLQTLHYLVMFRPPVKEICIEMIVDIYNTVKENKEDQEDLYSEVVKLLRKMKPEALEEE